MKKYCLIVILLFIQNNVHSQRIIKVKNNYVLIQSHDKNYLIGEKYQVWGFRGNQEKKIASIKILKNKNSLYTGQILKRTDPYTVEPFDYIHTNNSEISDNRQNTLSFPLHITIAGDFTSKSWKPALDEYSYYFHYNASSIMNYRINTDLFWYQKKFLTLKYESPINNSNFMNEQLYYTGNTNPGINKSSIELYSEFLQYYYSNDFFTKFLSSFYYEYKFMHFQGSIDSDHSFLFITNNSYLDGNELYNYESFQSNDDLCFSSDIKTQKIGLNIRVLFDDGSWGKSLEQVIVGYFQRNWGRPAITSYHDENYNQILFETNYDVKGVFLNIKRSWKYFEFWFNGEWALMSNIQLPIDLGDDQNLKYGGYEPGIAVKFPIIKDFGFFRLGTQYSYWGFREESDDSGSNAKTIDLIYEFFGSFIIKI